MSTVEKVKQAEEALCKVQMKYREFGAIDTEPSCVKRDVMRLALTGRPYPKLTVKNHGWQLYSSMKCGEANRELNKAARVMYNAIRGLKKEAEFIEIDRYYGLDCLPRW